MKYLQKWTICLNNSSQDDQVLQYVAAMARFYQPESLKLLHVMEGEEMPDLLLKEYSDLHEPEMEYYLNRLEEKRKAYLDGIPHVSEQVRKGNKLRSILEFLYETNSDLVILGRGSGRGTVMKKIARKSSASVMIVPENASEKPEHVLIATDFSAHASRALQIGTSLAHGLEIPKVSALHVYNDASKYVNQSVETSFEVDKLLQKRAVINEKLENYTRVKLEEHVATACPDASVEQLAISTPAGTKKSEALVQWVKDSDADFIILGAKGLSTAEAFFLGSFAEDVYSRLTRQVILLFKKEGENAGFLKLLLGKDN